ncbi:hypothetical protein SAMN05216600_11442 [Pseudomonas cuatrocienegasensis]|uniref:Uncharacterized protein n=1 Tax=Pseudomonas cuatrocienegasensis TaxID=543360 RepID=A0ABY1BKG0_9PSED|nr:hypothetical protein SAMN05216600_11442 [Pseudomonas cuatrocienegasensis]
MSALSRINLLVSLFFVLVTLAGLALLVRQAGEDVRRELQAAQAVVDYLYQSSPAVCKPNSPITCAMYGCRLRAPQYHRAACWTAGWAGNCLARCLWQG